MEYAIVCNNKGALLFERGHHCDAMQMFQKAMNSMLRMARDETSLDPISTSSCPNPGQEKGQGSLQATKNDCSSIAYEAMHGVCTERGATCALYDKPIKFHIEDLDPNNIMRCGETLVAVHKSVILFNMGLIHHVKNTSNALQKAMKIYKISYAAIRDIEDLRSSHDMYCRLVMAMLNNIAHVHEELGRFDTMQTVLGMLSDFGWSKRSFFSQELGEDMRALLTFSEIVAMSVAPGA